MLAALQTTPRQEITASRNALELPAGELIPPALNALRPALEISNAPSAASGLAASAPPSTNGTATHGTASNGTASVLASSTPTSSTTVRQALPSRLRERILTARQLTRRTSSPAPLPTADPRLDRLLGGGLERGGLERGGLERGGLARGELSEMVGRRSSGRFSLLLGVLAATTASGHPAVLIDLGDSFDPRIAAQAGLVLERLLWLRPRKLKEALLGAEAVLQGGFPLVVIDLGSPPVPGGRGAEGGWLRLARAARDRDAALLVSAPYRVSGTTAATVVAPSPSMRRAVWEGRSGQPRRLHGLRAEWTLEKGRGRAPGDHECWTWTTSAADAAVRLAAPQDDHRAQDRHAEDHRSQGHRAEPARPALVPPVADGGEPRHARTGRRSGAGVASGALPWRKAS
jgi:hypothetical protein